VSEAAAKRVISLPMHPYLTEVQQVTVVKALKEAVSS
jgi:dTDP-4-amino-4,6-dideoxygalactose transaminase